MSNKNNAIKFLFETYGKVNNKSIKEVLSKDYSEETFLGESKFTELSLKKYLMNLYNKFFYQSSDVEYINSAISRIREKMNSYYKDLNTRLDDAVSSSKAASVSDKSNIDVVNSIVYNPSENYNKGNSTAILEGKKIIGMSRSDDPKGIDGLNKLKRKNVQALLSDGVELTECIIKTHDNALIGQNKDIVNTGEPFIIEGISKTSGSKDLEINIDREEYTKFNNLSIYTNTPYVYTVFTSNDKIYYTKTTDKRILTSKLNLSFEVNTDRYVKIVVHLPASSLPAASGHAYTYACNGITIRMHKYIGKAVFESNAIQVNLDAEYIGIDTCDNFQNSNVSILYKISVDGGPWNSVRPIRKLSPNFQGLKSLLPLSNYTDKKIGVLSTYETISGRNIFSAEIPSIIESNNKFRFFNNSNLFNVDGNYVEVTGILYEDIEYDFGNMGVYINGALNTGVSKIYSGVNTISFPSADFVEIFNIKNAEEVNSVSKGHFKIKLKGDDQIYTYIDNKSNTNPFTLAIDIFGHDAIVGKEIRDEIEYVISDDYFKVSTKEDVKRIYILNRQRIVSVGEIKIRAELESIDTYTRPEISRITIRVA